MTRKNRAQRQQQHEDAVKQEAGRSLIFMDENPDKHVHLAEHRRRCVRQSDTVSVEAIYRGWDDAQRHNKSAGPGDVAQGRRQMQRRASKDARKERDKRDQKNIDRLMEQGRSRAAGIRPDRFGEQSDGEHNPRLAAPTRSSKRRSGGIGPMGPGARPGAPRG
jgi:hypothetical protein